MQVSEPCTVSDLSRATGETEEMVNALLGELQRRGVFSTTRAGVIFSRRLRKDAEISRKRAKSGSIGAAVRYGKEREIEVCHGKSQASNLAKASLQKPEASSVSNETGGEPPDVPKLIFDLGVKLLTDAGTKPTHARSLLGKWRKGFGDPGVLVALTDCQAKNISNPVEWLPKRLAARPASFLDSYKARAA